MRCYGSVVLHFNYEKEMRIQVGVRWSWLAEMDHKGLQRWITRLTDGCDMEESEVLLIG